MMLSGAIRTPYNSCNSAFNSQSVELATLMFASRAFARASLQSERQHLHSEAVLIRPASVSVSGCQREIRRARLLFVCHLYETGSTTLFERKSSFLRAIRRSDESGRRSTGKCLAESGLAPLLTIVGRSV